MLSSVFAEAGLFRVKVMSHLGSIVCWKSQWGFYLWENLSHTCKEKLALIEDMFCSILRDKNVNAERGKTLSPKNVLDCVSPLPEGIVHFASSAQMPNLFPRLWFWPNTPRMIISIARWWCGRGTYPQEEDRVKLTFPLEWKHTSSYFLSDSLADSVASLSICSSISILSSSRFVRFSSALRPL